MHITRNILNKGRLFRIKYPRTYIFSLVVDIPRTFYMAKEDTIGIIVDLMSAPNNHLFKILINGNIGYVFMDCISLIKERKK